MKLEFVQSYLYHCDYVDVFTLLSCYCTVCTLLCSHYYRVTVPSVHCCVHITIVLLYRLYIAVFTLLSCYCTVCTLLCSHYYRVTVHCCQLFTPPSLHYFYEVPISGCIIVILFPRRTPPPTTTPTTPPPFIRQSHSVRTSSPSALSPFQYCSSIYCLVS